MDLFQWVALLLLVSLFVLGYYGSSRGHFSPFLRIRLLSGSQTNVE
jgi:hypothetical protein